ncbi:hypothetical protein J2S49_000843 [Arcanobacterium wilhelmae]|uniref:DUF3953 domain-containing protein n=1 Tax=Arcanobacterium wilhelmae TaxID=1803177 RepID=A0ABT9NAM2_9ACTO|nr:hypothetical protein [Arcanobacterium wilhelmae]MDP9800767.1 hypothetical protein [Arcanobacterium wilhelmae]
MMLPPQQENRFSPKITVLALIFCGTVSFSSMALFKNQAVIFAAVAMLCFIGALAMTIRHTTFTGKKASLAIITTSAFLIGVLFASFFIKSQS